MPTVEVLAKYSSYCNIGSITGSGLQLLTNVRSKYSFTALLGKRVLGRTRRKNKGRKTRGQRKRGRESGKRGSEL